MLKILPEKRMGEVGVDVRGSYFWQFYFYHSDKNFSLNFGVMKQVHFNIIAWEPSAVKVTKSYSRRLPALQRFYREI